VLHERIILHIVPLSWVPPQPVVAHFEHLADGLSLEDLLPLGEGLGISCLLRLLLILVGLESKEGLQLGVLGPELQGSEVLDALTLSNSEGVELEALEHLELRNVLRVDLSLMILSHLEPGQLHVAREASEHSSFNKGFSQPHNSLLSPLLPGLNSFVQQKSIEHLLEKPLPYRVLDGCYRSKVLSSLKPPPDGILPQDLHHLDGGRLPPLDISHAVILPLQVSLPAVGEQRLEAVVSHP